MGNIFGTPNKKVIKKWLFRKAVKALEHDGWVVERIPGIGKSSVRRLSKNGLVYKAAIRTTQDGWISFPRDKHDKVWITLDGLEVVVVASLDDEKNPTKAQIHFIDANEVRQRFDRAYGARRAAKRKIEPGQGVWIPLYVPEAATPVNRVGAGLGLDHKPFATFPLPADASLQSPPDETSQSFPDDSITIAEAKRRLAKTLGVEIEKITITIEA
jgi:hypothetical protein